MVFRYSFHGSDLKNLTEVLMDPAEREKLFKHLNKVATMLGFLEGDTIKIDYERANNLPYRV